MRSQGLITRGDEKMLVELSVKEVMALSDSVHFHQDRSVLAGARNKLKSSLEKKLLHDNEPVQVKAIHHSYTALH